MLNQLLLAYPLSLLAALLAWLFLPSGRKGWFLISGLLPIVALVLLLVLQKDKGAELVLPFLQLSGGLLLELRFQPDHLHIGLALLVSFLSFLIQLYSLTYLKEEDSLGYFHFLISFFQLSMAGLFLSASLFSLFIFWELVGILSYLLVQFWYRHTDVLQSAFRVLMINKLGDLFLLGGLGLLLSFGFGFPVSVKMIFPEGAGVFMESASGQVICLFLMLSAVIKSAQFPFSVWLKRAMAGPTPVSALLHSATMVVAGVWLMLRLGPFMPASVLQVLAVIGVLSLLAGNLAALGSSQLKSTLAFSTMAQLGLMMAAIGAGYFQPVIFHLISHAFYKAGLFLLCGWLMHSLEERSLKGEETQSYDNLTGILAGSRWGKWVLGILLAALAGFPLTSGFISKEALLPAPWVSGSAFDWLLFAGMQLGSFLTAAYAGRIFLLLCFSEKKETPHIGLPMGIPISILALASGFWIFGMNPISSEGWLGDFLGLHGEVIRPDFLAALFGAGFAWWSRKHSFYRQFPAFLVSVFQEFRPIEYLLNRASRLAFSLAAASRKTDEKLLDSGLEMASMSVVVAGYFSSFTDKYILDGLLRFFGSFFYRLGGILFFQARHSARFAAWFALLILILLIYFSYYR